jgi:hypothetical protein
MDTGPDDVWGGAEVSWGRWPPSIPLGSADSPVYPAQYGQKYAPFDVSR